MSEPPPTSDPFAELEAYLSTISSPRSIHELLGLITAMVVGPSMIDPRNWLEAALMGAEAVDTETTRGFAERAMAAYDHCQLQLESGATLGPPPGDDAAATAWCEGLFAGSLLDEAWRKDRVAAALLFPIGIIAGRYTADAHRSFDAASIREKLPEWRRQLPAYTRRFFECFEQARAESALAMAKAWAQAESGES